MTHATLHTPSHTVSPTLPRRSVLVASGGPTTSYAATGTIGDLKEAIHRIELLSSPPPPQQLLYSQGRALSDDMPLYTLTSPNHTLPTPPNPHTPGPTPPPSKAVYAAPVTKTETPILTATATSSRPNDDATEWRRPSGP